MSRKRKRVRGRPGGPHPVPPRSAREVLREELGAARVLVRDEGASALSFMGFVVLLALLLGLIGTVFLERVGRWFAVVPKPARIVAVEDGNPVVLVDTGVGEPVRTLAHGTYAPGDSVDTTVRHAPFAPEVAVMGDHSPLSLFTVLAVLVCVFVFAVWAPGGLRASWHRRRRAYPHKGRVDGAELWVPVLLRAIPAGVFLVTGVFAGMVGAVRGAVGDPFAVGPIVLLTVFLLLTPIGIGSAVAALLRHAERAPVKVRPPARIRLLPHRVLPVTLVTVLLVGILAFPAGFAWSTYQERRTMAVTESGTAAVTGAVILNRRGPCRGRADLAYTTGGMDYRTTLDVDCAELEALRNVDTIRVKWSATAPEYVRWVR